MVKEGYLFKAVCYIGASEEHLEDCLNVTFVRGVFILWYFDKDGEVCKIECNNVKVESY